MADFATSHLVYAHASEMFYGGRLEQRLLRSTDGGANWEQAGGITEVLCIALGPGGRIWTGTADGRVEPLAVGGILWAEPPAPTPAFPPATPGYEGAHAYALGIRHSPRRVALARWDLLGTVAR